jgi:hypothetical protein
MNILSSDNNGYVNSFSFGVGSMSNEKIIFYNKTGLDFDDIVVGETDEC